MRPRINLSRQVAAGILALIAPCFLAAQGAPAVSLEEQLSAQYTLVKMGSDSSGPAVVEPGTILAIQKGGILGVPYGNMNMLPAKYQDGTLHPPTYYKSQVVFQFAKGYLAKASPPQIEDVIAQVFTIDDSSGNQQNGGGSAQGNQDAQGGQAAQAANEPPKQPETIQMGQTMDEVSASLGQPEKIVNLGPKQIYVYKDLKVTFVRGKVVDVQ